MSTNRTNERIRLAPCFFSLTENHVASWSQYCTHFSTSISAINQSRLPGQLSSHAPTEVQHGGQTGSSDNTSRTPDSTLLVPGRVMSQKRKTHIWWLLPGIAMWPHPVRKSLPQKQSCTHGISTLQSPGVDSMQGTYSIPDKASCLHMNGDLNRGTHPLAESLRPYEAAAPSASGLGFQSDSLSVSRRDCQSSDHHL